MNRLVMRNIAFFIFATMSIKLLMSEILSLINVKYDPSFFLRNDIFADGIKTPLAVRSVTAQLLEDNRIQSWPSLFKDYLLNNPYLSDQLSFYHLPPLTMLQVTLLAKLIVASNPIIAILVQFSVFLFGSLFLLHIMIKNSDLDFISRGLLILVFFMSYPTLFLMDRGNYSSGYTTLCVIAYFWLGYTNQYSFARIALLAFAINIRPNIAIFAMFELMIATNIIILTKRCIILSILIGCIFCISLMFSNLIEPNYTIDAFIKGLGLYNKSYILGDSGLSFGSSILGFYKILNYLSSNSVLSIKDINLVISIFGIILLVFLFILIIFKKISKINAIFILLCLNSLCMPVYGIYHLLVYFSPLSILVIEKNKTQNLKIYISPAIFLILMTTLVWIYPNSISTYAVALAALSVPLLYIYLAQNLTIEEKSNSLIILGSSCALTLIGGSMTNNLVITPILFSIMIFVIYFSLRIVLSKSCNTVNNAVK